ncbi:protein fem-1 homolog A [Danio rerio]|uniref:Protein fem-1 homolog A n=1 Tax=Danio rerio TaxID=7955 RepID=FEM1A_DANRE|nr:protein fem-1 homolog A [Danio rerio]Q6P9Z4.1 RecName: Full=Protein fem-1 homolog A; Short=FEM1a; AltName: Full=FEM1-alpha [Danio rerio]AAH60522.1 Fem-1 homolog a (C. elegans) [Danio rerio]|eukprot:NP_956131.1 protein fem-1 homolog A [Danio rerio]
MDISAAVFNAARDGKLKLMQKLLINKSPEERAALAEERTEGGTPLLIAARYGHLPVVHFLLERCGANVALGGSVNFDGETIEGAPPLWAASAAGHLPVVKALLEHGAPVNNTTLTNSTPLRAACFDGHLEIVRYLVEHQADLEVANRHGHTCLMISCYKGHREIAQFLLEKGADVNRKSVKGNTALHDCAESGSLEIMKMLLKCDARMERDGYGMTPLLAASVTGHTNIVEFLVHQPRASREQRIHALELLGATFVDKKRDLLGAMRYWRRAMELRWAGGQAGALEKPTAGPLVPAYDCSREVSTAEELEALITDPDDMRMQALLVRERILGPAHPDTSYYIRYRGAVYADSGNFERCIRLWKYALDMQQSNLEPLSPMTASSFLSFAELFSFVLQDRAKGTLAARVSFQDLMGVLSKSVREVERAVAQRERPPEPPQFSKALSIILHLLFLLQKLRCGPEQEHLKRQTVYRLLKLNPRARGGHTPLHMAVDRDTTSVGRYPVGRFPSLAVASLLLECGADVDSRDYDNNTPLHIAAANGCPDIMAALIRAGAHFDATNAAQQTAYQLLEAQSSGRHALHPLNHTTLQCLAARAVTAHRLPYKGLISEQMEAFIELH